MRTTKIYWWSGARNANFGDVLGPRLFEHFTNKKAKLATPEKSELVIVGSIIEHLPKPYTGTIAGAGFIYEKSKADLSQANVLALRGELSFKASGLKTKPLLADPGLVAPDLIDLNNVKVTHDIGVIAHYKHKADIHVPNDAMLIDITWPIEDVIEAAAKCKAISSSSLHGLILADALGKSRQWVWADVVHGKGHKFYDYFTSIQQKTLPGKWEKASQQIIKKKQELLREMLSCL